MAISKGGKGGAQRLGGRKRVSRPKVVGVAARGKAAAPGQLKKAAGVKSARSFTPAGAKAPAPAPLPVSKGFPTAPPLQGRPVSPPTGGMTIQKSPTNRFAAMNPSLRGGGGTPKAISTASLSGPKRKAIPRAAGPKTLD